MASISSSVWFFTGSVPAEEGPNKCPAINLDQTSGHKEIPSHLIVAVHFIVQLDFFSHQLQEA